jgi:hypothetical protein
MYNIKNLNSSAISKIAWFILKIFVFFIFECLNKKIVDNIIKDINKNTNKLFKNKRTIISVAKVKKLTPIEVINLISSSFNSISFESFFSNCLFFDNSIN